MKIIGDVSYPGYGLYQQGMFDLVQQAEVDSSFLHIDHVTHSGFYAIDSGSNATKT